MITRKKAAAVILSAVMLLSSCDVSEDLPPTPRTQANAVTVDPTSIRPQDDFYGYINAAYLLENLPEYGKTSSGSFAEVDKTVEEELTLLLEEILSSQKEYPAGSTEQLIRDIYTQGMSFDGAAEEMEKVRDTMGEIRAASDINELLGVWVRLLHTNNVSLPIRLNVDKNYFTSGENALFIGQTKDLYGCSMKELTQTDSAALTAKGQITDLLLPFTSGKDEAEQLATDAVYLLLDMAFATDLEVMEAADPFTTFTFMTDEETAMLLPNLGMSPIRLVYGLDSNPYGGYYIQDKGQLEKINELLSNERLEAWKTLLICGFVKSETDFIYSEAPSLASFAPSESKTREEIIAYMINDLLYDRISIIYSQRYFTPEKETALRDICETLRASYRELIGNAEWLSAQGRESLLRKLENISFVLGDGRAENTDPADAALIGDSFPETVRKINEKQFEKQKSLIGKPCDPKEPRMPAQMVNACYDPANIVTITVAILHAPFFDTNASDAANLGGLGMVVGHEMGHAFDSMCMEYNENGKYDPEWLSDADRKVLAERANALSAYYSKFTVLDVYHVDGVKTNGENYADLGAMECITNAVHTDGELTDLFENYARIWADNTLDTDAVDQIIHDVHSPAKIRVNAVLASCNKFCELYDVKEGDGMYKAPEERVSRW